MRTSVIEVLCAAAAFFAPTLVATAQEQLWARLIGTDSEDEVRGAAPDGAGGAVIVGRTRGNLGGPNSGDWDAWLARYNAAGAQVWVRQLGTDRLDEANAVASDGAGGVFVTGGTVGSLGGPNAGEDVWLAQYDSAGTQVWIRQFGTSAGDWATAAAPDGAGGVYVSGITGGSLGGPYQGNWDAFTARYDSAGNQTWVRQLGTTFYEAPTAVASDGADGVYFGGWTEGSLGGPNLGNYDVWLARYDGEGNQVWLRQFGTTAQDAPNAAAPDGTAGVYVTGRTDGSLGGPTAGSTDVWLARYDALGNRAWVRQFGTSGVEEGHAAAPDRVGGVYASGHAWGNLGGPNIGQTDIWFARYDSAGNRILIDQFGTTDFDYATAAAPDETGGLYLAGRSNGGLGGQYGGFFNGWIARLGEPCPADFDHDGFLTGLDFDAYVAAFEAGQESADFDADGFITGLDFDAFVVAFEAGCG